MTEHLTYKFYGRAGLESHCSPRVAENVGRDRGTDAAEDGKAAQTAVETAQGIVVFAAFGDAAGTVSAAEYAEEIAVATIAAAEPADVGGSAGGKSYLHRGAGFVAAVAEHVVLDVVGGEMGKVYIRYAAHLEDDESLETDFGKSAPDRLATHQAVDVTVTEGMAARHVYAGIDITEEVMLRWSEVAAHTFVIYAAEHAHICGYGVVAFAGGMEILSVEGNGIAGKIRKLNVASAEIAAEGITGIAVEVGGGIAVGIQKTGNAGVGKFREVHACVLF